MILHEVAKAPDSIRISFEKIIPQAISVKPKYRFGMLIMDLVVILTIYFIEPSIVFFQYLGLVALIHFVGYLVIGSLVNSDDKDNNIFPQINKNDLWIALPLAVLTFLLLQSYYLPMIIGVFQWVWCKEKIVTGLF